MPKKDVLRRIDHSQRSLDDNGWWYIDPQGKPQESGTAYSVLRLRVKEVDGSPTVIDVDTITVPNGSLTDDGGGGVTLTFATDGGKFGIAGSVWGELTVGSLSVAYTHLKADAASYDTLKATCEPVAPAGGLEITVLGETLSIAAGDKASGVTTLGSPGTLSYGDDVVLEITALPAGSFTGTVSVMIVDGSA